MTLIKAAYTAALLAMVVAAAAQGHPGNHWFTIASKQAQAIEDSALDRSVPVRLLSQPYWYKGCGPRALRRLG